VLNKIAPDKWKHLFVGIAMGGILQGVCNWLMPNHFYWASALALGLVIAVSYGWELFSKLTGRGHYEVMDAVFSIAGGIAGMGIAAMLW